MGWRRPEADSGNDRRARVLVVDDDHRVLIAIEQMLDEAGYAVLIATSAHQALELLDEGSVDVVVSDVNMPMVSGFELLQALRSIRPTLPVLLLTGSPTDEGERLAAALGAAGYLWKPVRALIFLGAVGNAVAATRG